MPSLIAKSPLDGQVPLHVGGVMLSELRFAAITSVAPLAGGEKALAKGLKALGVAFPAPNRFTEKGAVRLVWTGREQAFLIDAVAVLEGAALTDQTDGWAGLRLEGAGADQVLMRLYPIDLREKSFGEGQALRAPLNHMSSILLRRAGGFDVMVFRSMARTAWHEVADAMRAVAARAAVAGC